MKTNSLLFACLIFYAFVPGKLAAQSPASSCAAITYDIPVGGCTGSQNIFGGTPAEATTPVMSCYGSTYFESEGWYSFTVPAGSNQDITVTATSSFGSTDLLVQVMSGTCSAETEIGCGNAVNGQSVQTETVALTNLSPGVYFIRIVNVNGTSSMGMSNICVSGVATGIAESGTEGQSFSIFPNPFTSTTTLLFQSELTHANISVKDVLGRVVKTVDFSGRQLSLERAEMKAGIYFVQVTDDQQHVTVKKIVVE